VTALDSLSRAAVAFGLAAALEAEGIEREALEDASASLARLALSLEQRLRSETSGRRLDSGRPGNGEQHHEGDRDGNGAAPGSVRR
jgi:hypothetical protein